MDRGKVMLPLVGSFNHWVKSLLPNLSKKVEGFTISSLLSDFKEWIALVVKPLLGNLLDVLSFN